MEEDLQACNMQIFSISVIVILSVLGLVLGRKILRNVPGVMGALKIFAPRQHPVAVNLHREVAELRRTTTQIAQDWIDMTTLMTTVRDQQYSFIRRLETDFESTSDFLQNSVRVSLEEECLRNDQRFAKILRMIDGFREDFLGVKKMIQMQGEIIQNIHEKPAARVDDWTQTEKEMAVKKRTRDGHVKNMDEISGENEPSRSIVTVIRKALAEFLKEVKKHLSLQRDEGISDMRVIFSQLSEDRADIKNTIESAFSTAAYQTQKSFEQFGLVGSEAMKCIATLNERSENSLAARFEESGEKLTGIFELLKGLNFDVSSIKQVLDNIDGQFDEIYKKLELSCQMNTDHSEEVADRLQKTAEEWSEKSSNLEQVSKELNSVTQEVKETLCNLNSAICSKTTETIGMQLQQYSSNNLALSRNFPPYEDAYLVDKDSRVLEQYSGPEDFSTLPAMVQICFCKMNSLKDQIEHGSNGIKHSVETLMEKMNFLASMVEGSVEKLKVSKVQQLQGDKNSRHKQFHRNLSEVMNGIVDFDSNTIAGSLKEGDVLLEENSQSNDVPKLIGIIEANLEPDLNARFMKDSSQSSVSRARAIRSEKPSTMTGRAQDAPSKTAKDHQR